MIHSVAQPKPSSKTCFGRRDPSHLGVGLANAFESSPPVTRFPADVRAMRQPDDALNQPTRHLKINTLLVGGWRIGVHERSVNHMLGDEPDLHLIRADHAADKQVVRAIVAILGRLAGHRASLLEYDFMCL